MGMKEPTTRKIYNLQSHFYDELLGKTRYRQQSAIDKMQIQPGDRILDIGIGTGASLESYPPHCHITGIDISEELLQVAGANLPPVVELQRTEIGDFLDNTPDKTFDVILFHHVIEHIPRD